MRNRYAFGDTGRQHVGKVSLCEKFKNFLRVVIIQYAAEVECLENGSIVLGSNKRGVISKRLGDTDRAFRKSKLDK